VKRWGVIVAVVVAFVVGVWMLAHRQSATTEPVPAPIGEATVQGEDAPPPSDETESPNIEATRSVAATNMASSSSTTAGAFRGRLIDAVSRQPVTQEFEVQLIRVQRGPEWRQEDPLTRTFQSDLGRFAWNDLPAETWRATVSAHGYQRFDLGEVTTGTGKRTREVVMPLLRGFAVRGRVVAAATGAGIPEAYVTFRVPTEMGDNPWAPYAKAKEDGSFVLDGVPGGDITLTIGAQDFVSRTLDIALDEKTPPLDIALTTGGRIAGVVTTASGAQVAGKVTLDSSAMLVLGEQPASSSQFSFNHVAAGEHVVFARTATGTGKQQVILGEGERRDDIVVVVVDGHSVRGTIKGLRPEQLKNTFVSVRSKGAAGTFFTQRADEQGAYAINGVPPGPARIRVYAGDRQADKPLDMPADRDLTLDVVFPAGARLSGRVTEDGKPAAGKMVWMWVGPANAQYSQYRGTTESDGTYQIEGLQLGEYSVQTEGDISRVVTIAGDSVLNIDIPSAQLTGRVLEADSSAPVVGADVYVRGVAAATARVHGHKETNHFGDFSLTGIEPGEIVLFVYLAGYELYQEKISYSAPITKKTIALRKTSGVEVRVPHAANAEPIRGLLVSETIPGNELAIDLWIPLNREGVGYLPSALAGNKLSIWGHSEKPLVIDEWDGQSLELKL
jgi:carboxypeptidase family protein